MKRCNVTLIGTNEYCQSRFHGAEKLSKELPDAYEQRTWKEKAHWQSIDGKEVMVISPLAFKNCLSAIAQHLSMGVPGKGKATYTKHFKRGIQIYTPSVIRDRNGLPVTKETISPKLMHVPSDGVSGSGKRVMKIFPCVEPGWSVDVTFVIADDLIGEDVFKEHLRQSGVLIGIGAFRIENAGVIGTFGVKSFKWEDNVKIEELMAA